MQTCCRKLDFEIKSLPVCCFMLVVKAMSSQLPDPVVMPWPLIPSGTINLSQKQQESNWNTWKQAGLAKWPSPQYTFMQGEMHSSHRNGRRATPKLIVFPHSLITYVFYELLFRLQKLLSNVSLKPAWHKPHHILPPLLTILSSPLWGFNQDPKALYSLDPTTEHNSICPN